MMSNYKVPDSTTNHRQISPLPNIHNQIDGGAFDFSSSPRLITLYTSCKRGQNRGHYNSYVGFSIVGVSDFYPHILVVRVFFIKPSMGGDALPNVTSYTPNASARGSLVLVPG